eukprot:scaffold3273_cov363-Prasinococcus_capsulatus_cf.AAC.3
MSRQMFPYWSTFGWKHGVSNFTVGACSELRIVSASEQGPGVDNVVYVGGVVRGKLEAQLEAQVLKHGPLTAMNCAHPVKDVVPLREG